jgi:mannose-6-phosphate isomerase-like protein (cupin superfamily)
MATLDLSTTYICLSPDGAASTIEVTSDFWSSIDDRDDLSEGRLVAEFDFREDWPHWEMHPHGEEILVLLSGAMELVLDDGSGVERVAELLPSRAFIVPRGTWHRAIVRLPCRLLGITYGRGTEHRAR